VDITLAFAELGAPPPPTSIVCICAFTSSQQQQQQQQHIFARNTSKESHDAQLE
jgi:hypothetical protein